MLLTRPYHTISSAELQENRRFLGTNGRRATIFWKAPMRLQHRETSDETLSMSRINLENSMETSRTQVCHKSLERKLVILSSCLQSPTRGTNGTNTKRQVGLTVTLSSAQNRFKPKVIKMAQDKTPATSAATASSDRRRSHDGSTPLSCRAVTCPAEFFPSRCKKQIAPP